MTRPRAEIPGGGRSGGRRTSAPGPLRSAAAGIVVGLLAGSLFASLSGCRPGTEDGAARPPDTPRTSIEDGLGRKLSVSLPARRIVSLAPSNTEVLFAIGADSVLVGRDDDSNYPPEAAALPALGSTGSRVNVERLLRLDPDLVLVAEITSPEQVRALEQLGIEVFHVSNPLSFEALFANLALFGRISGREAAAADLIRNLEARVRTVEDRLRGRTARPSVFYELDASDATKPWTTGPGTFIDLLLSKAGGVNVGAALGTAYPRISTEELLKLDPEVIVLGDSRSGVTRESVARRAGWNTLRAVREARVYPFDDDLGSRPTPRLVDGLEALAAILHPELFPRSAPALRD